jgi:hypothetical protein
MKVLSEKFTKKGFKFTCIKREEDLAIYKRYIIGSPKTTHYEVVVITSHNGIMIGKNFIEPGELYPSSSQWGDKGFTCSTIDAAERKFSQLKKNKQLKINSPKKTPKSEIN